MIRHVFDVVEEPRDEVLYRLLAALGRDSGSAMMVLRDDLELSESGRVFISRLEPYLAERKRGSSWPGTTLLSDDATIFRFTLSKVVLDQLLGATNGLYEWQQPTLPEDLALLRDDGTVVLASICHERDAFLELSDDEYERLAALVPEVREFARRAAIRR